MSAAAILDAAGLLSALSLWCLVVGGLVCLFGATWPARIALAGAALSGAAVLGLALFGAVRP